MHWQSIPTELKQLNQWLVWKAELTTEGQPTKIPYNPRSGHKASVTDARTWSSFEDAVKAAPNYSGIGFVFTPNDPYTGIDLDNKYNNLPQSEVDRQRAIFKAFDSYSELSPSGNGLHVIIRGRLKGAAGVRRANIEVYSAERFFTFTGNVYHAAPIADRQSLLDILESEMAVPDTPVTHDGLSPEPAEDAEIYNRAASAVNGDKFTALWNGHYEWAGYASQSEGDFALIDMLGFYTQNAAQIKRLFHASALGQRDKAKRPKYVDSMIRRSFDRMPPPVDIQGLETALDKFRTKAQLPATVGTDDLSPFAEPLPGLVGEIARVIYEMSPLPVREMSVAAALALMAGICGRAYNTPTGAGLNLYLMLLAQSGTGKEAMKQGIDRMLNALTEPTGLMVPTARDFIGPSNIGSGPGLLRWLSQEKRAPSCVSIVGELANKFDMWTNSRSHSSQQMITTALLELYSASGHGKVFSGTAYSDLAKNIPDLKSPAYSILGESVPHLMFEKLNEDMISSGLLPRFVLIEYTGDRVPTQESAYSYQLPEEFLKRLASLIVTAHSGNRPDSLPTRVQFANADAEQVAKSYARFADSQIIGSTEVKRELWNRANLNMLKIASLIAVGVNPYQPVIEASHTNWAAKLVNHTIRFLMRKWERGDVGGGNENTAIRKLKDCLSQYLMIGPHNAKAWGHVPPEAVRAGVISRRVLQARLGNVKVFRDAREGAPRAITNAANELVSQGTLRRLNSAGSDIILRQTAKIKSGDAFVIVEPDHLVD